jgi:uncharacterized protein (DUF305 family)
MIRAVVLAGLALTLAACDGGGDPVQQALRDASAERQAAALKTTEELESRTPVAVATRTADQIAVAALIVDHEEAIEIARRALARSEDPEIRRMAQSVIDTRTAEIAELRKWSPAG